MKLFESVIEQHIRSAVNINEMQFGFMPGKGTMEAIFIICKRNTWQRKELYTSPLLTWRRPLTVSQGQSSGGRSGGLVSLSGSLRSSWLCTATARVR